MARKKLVIECKEFRNWELLGKQFRSVSWEKFVDFLKKEGENEVWNYETLKLACQVGNLAREIENYKCKKQGFPAMASGFFDYRVVDTKNAVLYWSGSGTLHIVSVSNRPFTLLRAFRYPTRNSRCIQFFPRLEKEDTLYDIGKAYFEAFLREEDQYRVLTETVCFST